MVINLTLPWPPSLNTLYPSLRSGRRVMSQKGRDYQSSFRIALARQTSRSQPTLLGRIGYRMRFLPPDRRKRDLPNVIKAVEDNLTKCGVWGDDSQVDDGHFIRGPVVRGGRVDVEIWEIIEAAPNFGQNGQNSASPGIDPAKIAP
jgi:crossover junction endodeoxyribonuclease RusA